MRIIQNPLNYMIQVQNPTNKFSLYSSTSIFFKYSVSGYSVYDRGCINIIKSHYSEIIMHINLLGKRTTQPANIFSTIQPIYVWTLTSQMRWDTALTWLCPRLKFYPSRHHWLAFVIISLRWECFLNFFTNV